MNKSKRLSRMALCLIVSFVMIMTLIPRLPAGMAFAAAGDTPDAEKTIIDNGDGTYTLSLDIVGESEVDTENTKANIVVILDRSGSMRYYVESDTGRYGSNNDDPPSQNNVYGNNRVTLYLANGTEVTDDTTEGPVYTRAWQYNRWVYTEYTGKRYADELRMAVAKEAVNDLVTEMQQYNAQVPNTVQMALVSFADTASTNVQMTGTLSNITNAVNATTGQNAINPNGGTNWEQALQTARNIANDADDDPTYVIFVTDGNPTRYGTGQGTGQETTDNINTSYNRATDDARGIVNDGFTLYNLGVFGSVDRMESLTEYANGATSADKGSATYYSVANKSELQEAFADIISQISENIGITDVDIKDGTTSHVVTESGVAHLLEVVPNSFKYYRSGGDYGNMKEWTSSDDPVPPPAYFNDATGQVEWDLSPIGVLENNVKYTVTFDVYPSQETYDLIAQLKNGDIEYSDVDPEIQKYISDGSYSLRTNTSASYSWKDTREDPTGSHSNDYTNPDPVATSSDTLPISKEWEGGNPDVDSVDITVLADEGTENEEAFHTATLTAANGWATSAFISVGIIKDGEPLPGAMGHDFSFAELDGSQYHWEIDAPVVRPMLINGGGQDHTPTMLIKVDDKHPLPSGAETYTIEGNTYYVDSTMVGLTATNHRRSNLNLTKVVTGEDAPKDAKFPFQLTVNNSLKPESAPSEDDDPNHESDWWVWLSVRDENGQGVTGLNMGSGVVEDSGGYYYAPTGTTWNIEIGAGWSLRFLNLPSDSKYTFVEGDLEDGFVFTKSELTQGEDSSFSAGQTTTGTIENTKTSYYVTYTNDYALTNLEITKVWEDNDDQDGKRLTADELKAKLTLSPAVEGKEPTVVDNEDGTYTITYTGLPRYNNGQEVEYTVAESAIDGYTTTGSPAKDHGTITNTHVPEVTKVKVVKVWNDSNDIGEIRPTSIQAQLKADGTESGSPVTLNDDNEWTYTWENLPKYKNGGTEIVYTADETAVPTGYDKTGPEKTTADDGTITFTVTNTYNPTPVSVDPPVQKIITGNDDLYNGGDFTFNISAVTTGAPMPARTEITNSAEYELEGKTGFYEFGVITFTQPGEYTYKVTESGEVDGVTNDSEAATGKTLTFTVTDDGTGKLVVNPTTDSAQWSFTNVYNADGEASIVVTKEITGAAWPAGKTLTLTIAGTGNAPMPEETAATLNAAGSVTFGPIEYGLSDAGKTYEYTITEDSFGAGWSGSPDSIKATVAVVDNGDGTLGTTVTYDPENATFTNTYTASGKATLEAIKAIKGAGWPEDGEITFTLAGTQSAPMPAAGGETRTLTEPGTATFGEITYTEADAGKTYTYTISEDGFGDGWTGSGDITATVVVTDNGNGTLKTEITYSPEDDTITNTYEAEGTAVLKAIKAIEGAGWPENGKITFTLAGEGGTLPETKTVTLTEPGTATFGAITYDESDVGKTYTYTITEDGFGDGWTADPGKVITATVVVSDNGDGTLKTEITYSPTDDTITNVYEAEGEAVLKAVKKVSGAGWPENGKITFTLAGEGGTLPETKAITLTEPGTATFGAIKYDESDAGKTYTYTITEDGFGDGWTADPGKVITATVKVTDNGDGTLKTEVTYSPENDTITNVYEAEGTAVLKAIKKVEGAAWPTGKTLTFTLAGEGGTLPETKTATLTAPGTATFGAITYDESDVGKTYTYTITEDGFGDGWTADPGKVITATVVVSDNGDGTLKTEITYSPTDDTITNVYEAEGEAEIEVTKAIAGAAWPTGKTLKVTITGQDGAPMPETTEVELTAAGKANFGTIEYDESDAGKTYTYTITEGSFGDGWSGSPNQITATVKVTDNGDGTLKTEVTYSPENATFTNTYNASGSVDIEVKKALEGRDWIEGETYTFTLYDAEETKIEDKTVSEDNLVAAFSTINYTEEDAGKTFTYTVKETSTLPGGISNSGDITVTVEVVDNGNGTLTATATYTDAEKEENDTITNKYDSEGEVELEAIKDLEGREWQEGETYTFTLKDAEGNVIDEQTVSSNSTVTFEAIEYTEEDMVDDEGNYVTEKTYTYTIEETTTLPDGMTNSGVITATVTVTDDGEGNITAEVTYDKDDTIVNTYESKGEATLKAKKALAGRAWLDGEKYTFTLTAIDGAPMPKEGTTVDFTADGEKSFGTIKYTQEDMKGEDGKFLTEKTYKYTISETSTLPSGIEKSGDITATVVLKDDGNGNITATVTYDPDSDTIINTYTAEGSATLKAKKLLKGRAWMDSESYTFTLKDPNGTVVEEKTVTADGEITFAAIKYDESDAGKTYTYTITETGNSSANVTASDPIQAKVEVIDNGDGTLKTNVTYTPEDDTIINTYVPTPVNAQINVNKTIDGYVTSDKGSSDNVFEFTLYDKDGKQVGDKITITTKEGTGSASFAPIQYTEVGEYTYTVKETLGSAAGYTYSTIEYPVVVTVTDDPVNGKLDASVSYGDYTVTSGDETLLDVINEFDMTDVDVTLTLTKTIDDQSNSAPDGTFTFKLYKDSVSEENFVEEKTITTKGLTGSVDFSKLTFDKSGEYTYVVVEEAGDVNGFSYDTTEHTYKIIIDDNFDAAILEVNEDSTLEAEITNVYKAKETSNILKVKKEINDTSGSAYETTFTFTLKDADGNKIDEVTVVGAEEGEFKAIEYDKAGTYEYTITEVAGDDKGYQYDTAEYKVTVTVEDKNGELVATSAYIDKTGESQTSLTVTNTYDPEDAKIVIQAEKKVDDKTGGAAENPKTFTFELLDADGNVIETVSRVGGGTVTFSELTYSKVGEYNYTVREVAGDDKGYTYDTSEYPVTVTVTDPDKDGILKAAITVGDSVEFINPYEAAPTSAKIQVNKALAGRDLVEGEFTFKLEELVDGEAVEVGTATNTAKGKVTFDKIKYTMPGEYTYVVSEVVPEDTKGVLFDEGTIKVVVKVTDDGNGQLAAEVQYPDDKTFNNQYAPEGTYTPEVKKVLKGRDLKKNEFTFKMVGPDGKVYTAKNDADGNVVFDELEFGVDDIGETYTYTITEKKGNLKYVKYDDHEVTLTLTITDNGDGTLKIKADYDGNKTFTNKYKKPTPPKTGDTTQVLPYMLMFTVALLGLILVFRRRKAVRK